MEVDFAFICDYADATGPKVHALGIGFDTIFAANVPAKHPQFTLVAQLRASPAELGLKEVAIRLIDADGNILINIPGQVNLEKAPGGIDSVQKLAVAFHMVEFPRYGDYALHLLVGGNDLHRVRLRVVPLPQPPNLPREQGPSS